jgi:acyl carrier protein
MELKDELKKLIIETLELDEVSPADIKDDEPLFTEGLGLDSIDALELGMALKKKYSIKMSADKEANKKSFYSINTLSEFVRSQING